MARGTRRWIAPVRKSFPDVKMEIVELIAEGETVVGRIREGWGIEDTPSRERQLGLSPST